MYYRYSLGSSYIHLLLKGSKCLITGSLTFIIFIILPVVLQQKIFQEMFFVETESHPQAREQYLCSLLFHFCSLV